MNIIKTTFYRSGGQATISTVLLIGGIALSVAVTLSIVAISFLNSTFAFQSANKAMTIAVSGEEDALLKLARTDSPISTYTVPSECATECATVTITRDSPAVGQVTILSTATVFDSRRKIQVVASVDQLTRVVTVISFVVQTL